MIINSDSNSEQIETQYALKIANLESTRNMRLMETLNKNRRIQLPVFFLSLLFVLFVWMFLNMNRTFPDSFIVSEIVVNFGFNMVFTFGFSYALLYLLNFKHFANMFINIFKTSDAEDKKENLLFILSITIGFVLTMVFSMTLYHLWIDGDAISPFLDFAILCAIFIHMLIGLNCCFTVFKIKKISKEYNAEIIQLINEFKTLNDVISNKVAETNETMAK